MVIVFTLIRIHFSDSTTNSSVASSMRKSPHIQPLSTGSCNDVSIIATGMLL